MNDLQSFAGSALVLSIYSARIGGIREKAHKDETSHPPLRQLVEQIDVTQCKHFLSVVNNECKGTSRRH